MGASGNFFTSTSACVLQEGDIRRNIQIPALFGNSSCAGHMPLLLAHASATHS